MTAPDTVAAPPAAPPHDLHDRLTALRNAAHIIRLTAAAADPVVTAALRMIEQQVEHLSRWADELPEC